MRLRTHDRPIRRPPIVLAAIAAAMALALPVVASAATPESRQLPADLAGALDAYNRATIGSDIAGLAAIVTDDYMLVNSDASVQDKASYLADFAVPGFKLDPYVVEQPVYKVRGDTALTGGVFRLNWTQQGGRHDRRLRIVHFWVKQGDRWQISYTQLTRVPD
ncbi:nuclear transport factor 2 family protein [Sphingomonas sp. So64.6b]|uniref:nuclear transport factor 2 family protein n=1 Tax=Sphingomonas sp. So64.6b TaxID=2997354 RepID=UPI0015FECE35|nr:nuclear transport factor 2 family protein [Sphingomonas sp. So64.6b]QNA84629.1 nuclear transport factor 2 family protein [Sphingomonas sp. So64.6b]